MNAGAGRPSLRRPRIIMVHAYQYSMAPMEEAFARLWPEAEALHLFDQALYADTDPAGTMTESLVRRVDHLLEHSRLANPDGIVFTGSTFGPAVDAVRASYDFPVLRADEAVVDEAVSAGSTVAVVSTAERSLRLVITMIEEAARAAGVNTSVRGVFVPGAAAALHRGDTEGHDRSIADAVMAATDCDVVMLSQMSMSGATRFIENQHGRRVINSSDAAVTAMRAIIGA